MNIVICADEYTAQTKLLLEGAKKYNKLKNAKTTEELYSLIENKKEMDIVLIDVDNVSDPFLLSIKLKDFNPNIKILGLSEIKSKNFITNLYDVGYDRIISSKYIYDDEINYHIKSLIKIKKQETTKTNKNMERMVSKDLITLGVKPYKGFKYLVTIMTNFYKDYDSDLKITKDFYPFISKIYGVKCANVEHNIRTAIKDVNVNPHNAGLVHEIFSTENLTNISNGDFIHHLLMYYNRIVR